MRSAKAGRPDGPLGSMTTLGAYRLCESQDNPAGITSGNHALVNALSRCEPLLSCALHHSRETLAGVFVLMVRAIKRAGFLMFRWSDAMNVVLSAWKEEANCAWCEKPRECVTTEFEDGFLKEAPLCWSCLQKAVKVRAKQEGKPTEAPRKAASN